MEEPVPEELAGNAQSRAALSKMDEVLGCLSNSLDEALMNRVGQELNTPGNAASEILQAIQFVARDDAPIDWRKMEESTIEWRREERKNRLEGLLRESPLEQFCWKIFYHFVPEDTDIDHLVFTTKEGCEGCIRKCEQNYDDMDRENIDERCETIELVIYIPLHEVSIGYSVRKGRLTQDVLQLLDDRIGNIVTCECEIENDAQMQQKLIALLESATFSLPEEPKE